MVELRARGGGWSRRPEATSKARGGQRAGKGGRVWDRTGLHRPCSARRKDCGPRGAAQEGFRATLGGMGTEETPPRGSCHVSTAPYPPLGVGDSLAPRHHPPSASVRLPEPGTRLAVRGVAPEGSPVLEPRAAQRQEPGRGAAVRRANGKTHPARLFWGGEGNGAPGPFPPPRNSGKTAIAEVGRARRPFFPEWVEMFDAYSPSTLKTQA